METPKDGSNGAAEKNAAENPCRDPENQERSGSTDAADDVDVVPDSQPSRRPFTSLSQEDSDLILARALQEQERAYMMLRMGGGEYESSHSGSYVNEEEDDDEDEDDDDHLHEDVDDEAGAEVDEIEGEIMNEEISEGVVENVEAEGEEDIVGDRDEDEDEDDDDVDDDDEEEEEDEDEDEDVFDVHERELEEEIDPANFDSDEAYARALQEAEERGLAARMMAIASINEWEDEDEGDEEDRSYSQDTWQEVDPDELSYEELLALSEVVGTESRGLSADVVASLPSSVYNPKNSLNGTSDQCVICRVDYEEGERVIILSCKHTYHAECINNWLQINKVCPVCNVEVSASNQG